VKNNDWSRLNKKLWQRNYYEYIVMPNHFHGIIAFVGVPLVGTQNAGQPITMGQPQGIAPTLVIRLFAKK